jgi:hypothetical protein
MMKSRAAMKKSYPMPLEPAAAAESAKILTTLGAECFAEASAGFPPASVANDDYMSGVTTDPNGRKVMVTFYRHLYRRHSTAWHAWNIHAARFADER